MNAQQLVRMARRAIAKAEKLADAEQHHRWIYPWCRLGEGEARRWVEKAKALVEQAERLARPC